MGVNGATIANVLTARHPTQLQGAPASNTASPPAGAAAPASDPAPAEVEPATAAISARRDVKLASQNPTIRKVHVHARQDLNDPIVDTTTDTDSADADDDDTAAEADPDVDGAAADTTDTTAVTRAVHARQDEDDTVDPTTANDSEDADEGAATEDESGVEDAATEVTETADGPPAAQVSDVESLDTRGQFSTDNNSSDVGGLKGLAT
ncbi:unnamed protein product [Cyclocybe aegerita]|uniref:Uncharacterized protein n=1 Tax=Cyclocybe aegerita TaxID=1973307 RepID=A0A8S0VR01_CYCAE|nr:unnamed protein product [Cyclocybe aegerita]